MSSLVGPSMLIRTSGICTSGPDPAHQQTLATFLGRVVRGAIEAFVGILVLDELFYRLLLARVKDATGRNPLEVFFDLAIEDDLNLVYMMPFSTLTRIASRRSSAIRAP